MNWTRSQTLAMSSQSCTHCFGLGLVQGRNGADRVCKCVLRAVFRECHKRFQSCHAKEKFMSRIASEWRAISGRVRRISFGMPNEEYIADFLKVARRSLSPADFQLFRWVHLLGADYRLVNRKLGRKVGDRNTFHDIYRIEERLGRAYAELQPYALWPLDEYFGSQRRKVTPTPIDVVFALSLENASPLPAHLGRPRKLRVPLKVAA